MKNGRRFAVIAAIGLVLAGCAAEQGYTTDADTPTGTHSDAVRTAGSSSGFPNQGPSMMNGGAR